MSVQTEQFKDTLAAYNWTNTNVRMQKQQRRLEPMFYYFAYGSCMCPVDLKRSLGEKTHIYVVGAAVDAR